MGTGRTGWAVLLIAVGVAASCSSAPEVNTDPVVVTTAPTTTAAPTTVAPTTTTPPTTAAPTTTVAPTTTTTVGQVEADILAAVDGFFEALTYDVNTGAPPDPSNPIYEQWITDPQLTRTVQNARSYQDAGQTWVGSIEFTVKDVAVDGDRGTVVVCVLDRTTGLEADGETVFSEPDTEIVNTSLAVLRNATGWKISEWVTAGGTCSEL